jgi:hypothetical protein
MKDAVADAVKETKKVAKIDPELERFYSALGQFNTNVVAWLIKEPYKVGEIADLLIELSSLQSPGRCSHLGPDYQWSETMQACLRKAGPGDFTDEM